MPKQFLSIPEVLPLIGENPPEDFIRLNQFARLLAEEVEGENDGRTLVYFKVSFRGKENNRFGRDFSGIEFVTPEGQIIGGYFRKCDPDGKKFYWKCGWRPS